MIVTTMVYDPFAGWTPLNRPGCGGGRSGPTSFVRYDPMNYGNSLGQRGIEILSIGDTLATTRPLFRGEPDFQLASKTLSGDAQPIAWPENLPSLHDILSLPPTIERTPSNSRVVEVRHLSELNCSKVRHISELNGSKVRNISKLNGPKVRNLSDMNRQKP